MSSGSSRPTAAARPARASRWLPDLDVFTDIDIPARLLCRHAAPAGRRQRGRHVPLPQRSSAANFETQDFVYENGIHGLCRPSSRAKTPLTTPVSSGRPSAAAATARTSRNTRSSSPARAASPTRCNRIEHYHNSSWLEHGGAPEKAVQERLRLRHRRLSQATATNITKSESQDHLPGRRRTA